jgi:hypothetical protein
MNADTRAALAQGFSDCRERFSYAEFLLDATQPGSWEGPVAVLPLSGGVVRIDCAAFTVSYKNAARVADEFARMKRGRIETSRPLGAGDVVVEVIAVESPTDDCELNIFGQKRVDLWMPKTGERKTILEYAAKVSVSPAPDGRKLAIRYSRTSEATSGPERIIVFDDKGFALADFEIEAPAKVATQRPQAEPMPVDPPVPVEAAPSPRAQRYAELLTADPALREELEAANRYIAACAALMCGRDDSQPDAVERARLRGLALGWLNEDLALRKRQIESGAAGARAKVHHIIEQWRVERDLAGIRDGEALAKLPVDEQKAWRALWAEVDALEKRSRPARP